jgi:hypothetical protein
MESMETGLKRKEKEEPGGGKYGRLPVRREG